MSYTLEIFPADGSASVKKDLTATGWGFEKEWGGSFRSLVPDELRFVIKKTRAAILDTFQPRSQFILRDGANNILFQGVNSSDGSRKAGPISSTITFTIFGPWWWLEGLPFSRTVHTDYWTGGGVNQGTHKVFDTELTAFNLNRTPDGTFQATRAQLIEIANFAIGKGASFQFDGSTFPDIAILPQPWQNGLCANAIRAQLATVDAVVWFDHSTVPPTLHIKQSVDCTAATRTLGPLNQVIDWDLTKRDDMRVPYVALTFIGGVVQNGVTFNNPQTFTYPNPRPAGALNNFYPLVATVPLNPLVINTSQARIYTMDITGDLAWLKLVRPEYDAAQNPKAADEYQNLTVVSVARQTNLPRMFIAEKGNYASWMGGNVVRETINVVISYSRKVIGNLKNTVQSHTVTIPVLATDLSANSPGGSLLTSPPNISAVGENPADFSTLPQTIYNTLNAPCYDGFIKCLEPTSQGWISLGNVVNLLGAAAICRPEWNTMRALVHEVEFETHGGAQFFVTAHVGVNKKITTGEYRERIEAQRLLKPEYNFSYSGNTISPNTSSIEIPDQRAGNGSTDGAPVFSEHSIVSATDVSGNKYIVRTSSDGSSNLPVVEIKKVDASGAVVSASPQISLAVSDIIAPGVPLAITAKLRDWGNGVYVHSTGVASTGGGITMMKITGISNDFISAVSWDGVVGGTIPISIAKNPQFRMSQGSEIIDGVTIVYTWIDANNRTADDGANREYQVVYPRYTIGDVIYAAQITPNSGALSSAPGVNPKTFFQWMEIKHARVWARRFIQPSV